MFDKELPQPGLVSKDFLKRSIAAVARFTQVYVKYVVIHDELFEFVTSGTSFNTIYYSLL